jgi:hypothetical protein
LSIICKCKCRAAGGGQNSKILGDRHLVFTPKSAMEIDEVPWSVSLPMFKDAVADAATARIVVVVTTTEGNGSQSIRSTIDVKQHAVFKCQ